MVNSLSPRLWGTWHDGAHINSHSTQGFFHFPHPSTHTIQYVIRGALCLEEFTDPVNAVVLEHILLFFEEGTVQSEKSPFRGRGNGF